MTARQEVMALFEREQKMLTAREVCYLLPPKFNGLGVRTIDVSSISVVLIALVKQGKLMRTGPSFRYSYGIKATRHD